MCFFFKKKKSPVYLGDIERDKTPSLKSDFLTDCEQPELLYDHIANPFACRVLLPSSEYLDLPSNVFELQIPPCWTSLPHPFNFSQVGVGDTCLKHASADRRTLFICMCICTRLSDRPQQ